MISAPLSIKAAGFVVLAAAAPVAAPPACPNVTAPKIVVEMAVKDPVINHAMSAAQMRGIKADTTVPYQIQQMDHVDRGGIMKGDIHIDYLVSTSTVPGNTAETVNKNCVRYDSVTITLTLAPTVMIASDYDEQSCWYEQVYQHEMSHIDMDRVVIEKYKERLKDGLGLAFSQPQDAVQGPVEARGVKGLKKAMNEQLMSMTDGLLAAMARERQEKQQGVDSAKNLAYIMNQCYRGGNIVRAKP